MKKPIISRMNVNAVTRMFDAALPDRMTASWDSSSYTIDQVIYQQLDVLRARARQQARNNDYVARFIQTLKSNVVGATGFKLRARMQTKSGKPLRNARKIVEGLWAAFDEKVFLVDLENLIMSAMVTDGEAFVFLRVDKSGCLRPELIEPVRVDTGFNEKRGDNHIIMGIEYDNEMNVVAYHINDVYDNSPHLGASSYTGSRTRIEATHILHVFMTMFVGQKRGIPWVAQSLGRLFQLGKAEEASITAFRIGAAKMGFFRSTNDDQYGGDEESGEMMMNAEAGTFENIGSLEFQAFDPTFPNGEVAPFVERMLKGISAGWGVDYHTIANDLSGVNYSSARVGMLETREMYKSLQAWFIRQFVRPLYQRWAELSWLNGDFGKALQDSAFFNVTFIGRRWDWVDPQKEAVGKKKLYEMKVISLSQIIRERGDEPEDVFTEIAEENELMARLGITPEQVLKKVE